MPLIIVASRVVVELCIPTTQRLGYATAGAMYHPVVDVVDDLIALCPPGHRQTGPELCKFPCTTGAETPQEWFIGAGPIWRV